MDPANQRSPKQARIAVAVFFFISGFGFATWASRIPAIQQSLQLNEAELGGVLFALPVGLLATFPLTSYLLTRFSCRRVMTAGTLLFTLVMSLLGFAATTWQLVVLLFCFGSSRNLLNVSMNAQSVIVQGLYQRSIIAVFHGVWSTAGFAGAAVGSVMVSLGVIPAYHFISVAVLLAGLALAFYGRNLEEPPAPKKSKSGLILPDRSMLKLGMIAFGCMACEGTMYDWSAIYFQKVVEVSSGMATAGFAIYMTAMTTGRFTGDRVASRFGIRNVLIYSGMLIGTGLLMAALLPYIWTTIAGFIMVGLGVSCVVPMVFAMAGRSRELANGPAIAAVSTVGYFGFLIVPPFIGVVAQIASLQWSFALIGLLGFLITWLGMKAKTGDVVASS